MKRNRAVISILIYLSMVLSSAVVFAQNGKKQENGLLMEEMLIHYDKLFEKYLEIAKKDVEELKEIVEPLKKKAHLSEGNSALIDSLYTRAQYEHVIMLENMIELLYAKMSLTLFLEEPEKKESIEKLRKKYESKAEYEKLLEKIDAFREKIKKEKEKITTTAE